MKKMIYDIYYLLKLSTESKLMSTESTFYPSLFLFCFFSWQTFFCNVSFVTVSEKLLLLFVHSGHEPLIFFKCLTGVVLKIILCSLHLTSIISITELKLLKNSNLLLNFSLLFWIKISFFERPVVNK